MNKHQKFNSILYGIVFAVLVLVLFSTRMAVSLYARFSSSADGSDSARVAIFNVDCKGTQLTPMKIDLDFFNAAKHEDEIEFAITSSSEVAVSYEVSLILPDKLTELIDKGLIVVKIAEKNEGTPESGTITSDGITFFTKNLGVANEEIEIEYVITFTIPTGAVPGEIIKITEPATLCVHVEQID